MEAVDAFLAESDEFEIDSGRENFLLTFQSARLSAQAMNGRRIVSSGGKPRLC